MDGVLEAPAGPAVSFPDPALVAEVAAIEAEQPQAAATFSWFRSIAWALVLALVGSGLYAGVAYVTEAQWGIVSIVIGVLAGIGAARGGRSRRAQIVGASAAAIGYFAGQLLTVSVVLGFNVLDLPIGILGEMMWLMIEGTFTSIDALFLGIAVYEGWVIPRART